MQIKSQKGFTVIDLLYVVMFLTIIIGWIMNIWRMVQYFPIDFAVEGIQLILRVAGMLVAPLGAILGFIPF